MGLSLKEVLERIEKPKNEALLKRAQFDNDWCRFHARISTKKEDAGAYFSEFKKSIDKILTDPSKNKAFWDLLPLPFPTTQFISEAQDELNKVFYANDKEVELELKNNELEEDFEYYLSEELQVDDYIDKVYNLAFESPNAVLIFDIDRAIVNKWPSPYIFHIQPEEIIDIDINAKGEIEFIVFLASEKNEEVKRYAVLDDKSYRLIEKPKADTYILTVETPHTLDYCPSCFVWPDEIEGYSGVRRNGLLVPHLAKFDRILRSEVFEEHADLFAAHPIMQIPETPCEVEGCENGYITRRNDVTGEETPFKCTCQSGQSVGPGSTIEVPTAAISEGIGQVVQFINSPVESLQYFTDKVDKLRQDCFLSLTGGNYSQVTKDAVNEKQVQQGNDRKRNRLIYVGEMMERVHQFIINTVGKLRYDTAYKGSLVKYGVEFDLETLTDAVERYNLLKNANMPQYVLGQQMKVIDNLFSRSNSDYEKRANIVKLIEPFRNTAITNIPIDSIDYTVKLRFLEYIDRFEMENGSIIYWGSAIDLKTKVKRIKAIIYDYAKESTNTSPSGEIGQKGDSLPLVSQRRQPIPRT